MGYGSSATDRVVPGTCIHRARAIDQSCVAALDLASAVNIYAGPVRIDQGGGFVYQNEVELYYKIASGDVESNIILTTIMIVLYHRITNHSMPRPLRRLLVDPGGSIPQSLLASYMFLFSFGSSSALGTASTPTRDPPMGPRGISFGYGSLVPGGAWSLPFTE